MVHSLASYSTCLSTILLVVMTLALLPATVHAQGFFEHFFGGHQQQRQPSPAEQWRAHGASIDCSGYLCPTTFDCVANPTECPCPAEQDVKCLTGHGDSYVCVRGDDECQRVNQMKKAI